MYADVELMLTGFVRTRRSVHTATETPADLTTLPVVVVRRLPAGGAAVITLDVAIVDVDVYAADRAAARLLSEQIRSDFTLHLAGYIANGGVISNVESASAPAWVPYDNTSLRKYSATYRVTVHSTP